jgi:hypothetical protein
LHLFLESDHVHRLAVNLHGALGPWEELMRAWRAWAIGAVAAMGLSSALACAADDEWEMPDGKAAPQNQGSWFSRLFRAGESNPDHAPWDKQGALRTQLQGPPRPKADTAKKPAEKPATKPPVDGGNTVRARYMDDFLRQQAVCNRLSDIAAEKNDLQLMRKAQELEERAWGICQARLEIPKKDKTADLDESIIAKRAGSPASSSQSTSPLLTSDTKSAPDKRTAEVREVKP